MNKVKKNQRAGSPCNQILKDQNVSFFLPFFGNDRKDSAAWFCVYLFILNDNLIRFSCLLLLLLLLGWPIIHFWIYGLKTLGLLIHNWALSPYSTGDNDDLFYLYSYNLIINDICYFPLQIC
jgi:hypothetical protein